MAVLAMVIPSVELYHNILEMTISVIVDIQSMHNLQRAIYFTNDPLWDGAGCVSGSCCTFNSPPWFCKSLSTPTTDDIQLRLCLDEVTSNEDVLFEIVELYVQ